jgi:hypothetical protein
MKTKKRFSYSAFSVGNGSAILKAKDVNGKEFVFTASDVSKEEEKLYEEIKQVVFFEKDVDVDPLTGNFCSTELVLSGLLKTRLESMEHMVLAAAKMTLSFYGTIPAKNVAFKAFRDAKLIKETGDTTLDLDVLLAALSDEITNRILCPSFL